MSIKTAKRIAARIMKCGQSRVCIIDAKAADEALSHDDVLSLINQGLITERPAKGVGRGKARFKQARKNAGRRRGKGSSKGTKFASVPRKTRWITKVRSQRIVLKKYKSKLQEGTYSGIYRMVKGNNFRDKKHLKEYLEKNVAGENKDKEESS